LVVAGQKRIFIFEPGHDPGVHRILLDETLKMVCWAFFMSGSCRRARFVAAWSPGPTGIGPLELVSVGVGVVFVTGCEA